MESKGPFEIVLKANNGQCIMRIYTVPFKSKLTLDSRSSHESGIENRVENRDSILDDYVSILDECVLILDVCVSILELDSCETGTAFV